jgi:hypothetical protein
MSAPASFDIEILLVSAPTLAPAVSAGADTADAVE